MCNSENGSKLLAQIGGNHYHTLCSKGNALFFFSLSLFVVSRIEAIETIVKYCKHLVGCVLHKNRVGKSVLLQMRGLAMDRALNTDVFNVRAHKYNMSKESRTTLCVARYFYVCKFCTIGTLMRKTICSISCSHWKNCARV